MADPARPTGDAGREGWSPEGPRDVDEQAPPTRRAMLAATAIASAVFAVAAAVALDAPRAFDERLLTWVAERRPATLTELSDVMATLGSSDVITPISIVAVMMLLAFRRLRAALLLAVAMIAEKVINPILKSLFGLPRPSGALAVHEYAEPGFPSGHAMAAATICTVLVLLAWPTRWRTPAVVGATAWTLSMGLSRVCLGVHWPTDVIGGWAAGVALACGLGALIGVSPASRPASRRHDRGSHGRGVATTEAGPVRVVLFDWGNTLMVDDGRPGRMMDRPRVAAVPGAAETLANLHGRYRLCVATNADDSGEKEVMAALERVGLARFIDRVFSSRDIGAHKPDKAFYAAVMATLRAEADRPDPGGAQAADCARTLLPAQIVMVGDDLENDVRGAMSSGLRAVWFRRGHGEPARDPAADGTVTAEMVKSVPVVTDLRDLPRLLECAKL